MIGSVREEEIRPRMPGRALLASSSSSSQRPRENEGRQEKACAIAAYSVKLTKSQLGPDTPMAECDVSWEILSKFRWYNKIECALD